MKIFLSYASEDKAIAEQIAFSLRSRGHLVFLDRDDLPPGQSYDLCRHAGGGGSLRRSLARPHSGMRRSQRGRVHDADTAKAEA